MSRFTSYLKPFGVSKAPYAFFSVFFVALVWLFKYSNVFSSLELLQALPDSWQYLMMGYVFYVSSVLIWPNRGFFTNHQFVQTSRTVPGLSPAMYKTLKHGETCSLSSSVLDSNCHSGIARGSVKRFFIPILLAIRSALSALGVWTLWHRFKLDIGFSLELTFAIVLSGILFKWVNFSAFTHVDVMPRIDYARPDLFFVSLNILPEFSWIFVFNIFLAFNFIAVLVRWPFWPNKFLVNFELLLVSFSVFMSLFFLSFNLVVAFVCLEGFSFALYALSASGIRSHSSVEAAIKYFCLGSVSSGLFLYGISLLYGLAGSLNFFFVRHYLLNFAGDFGFCCPPGVLYLSTYLLVFGFLFKLSAFPCHFWTPDVYEGSPTPVTALFATFAKLGVFLFFLKFLLATFFSVPKVFTTLLVVSAVGSLTVGCLGALVQKKIKRFIAYTSINQIGFLLMGVSCGTFFGAWSSFLYLQVYYIMSLAFFSFLFCFWVKKGEKNPRSTKWGLDNSRFKFNSVKRELHKLYDIAGLFGVHNCRNVRGFMFNPEHLVGGTRLAFLATVVLFSMAGIPPLGGFFSKYYILVAVSESSNYLLVIFGLFVNVISAFYYIKIVNRIWFTKPRVFFGTADNESHTSGYTTPVTTNQYFSTTSLEFLSLCACVTFLVMFPFYLEDIAEFSSNFVIANVRCY